MRRNVELGVEVEVDTDIATKVCSMEFDVDPFPSTSARKKMRFADNRVAVPRRGF